MKIAFRPKFDDRRLFSTLVFLNGLEKMQFCFQDSDGQSILYIFYKFGEIWISDPGV